MSKARLVITAVIVERRPVGEVAGSCGVARSWIYTLLARYRAEGQLPKVFRPDTTAWSFVAKTVADLEEALSAPNDSLLFIESVMDPYDALAAVIHSSNNGAELDYGPWGPKHRGNAQLRSAI
jgi:indolepyruvate decarboxylase